MSVEVKQIDHDNFEVTVSSDAVAHCIQNPKFGMERDDRPGSPFRKRSQKETVYPGSY